MRVSSQRTILLALFDGHALSSRLIERAVAGSRLRVNGDGLVPLVTVPLIPQ